MNKELEGALEYVNGKIADLEDNLQHYTMVDKDKCREFYIREDLKQFTTIKQALQRLETIDNANPSEALECLERINKEYATIECEDFDICYATINQALLKAQEQEKENVELKRVLETIKEKSDLSALEMANNVDEFNEMTFHKKPYTEEEFDLLKRWIENENNY